ncbi:cytochrome c oxidase assembly protein [Pelagibacterium sp. 26DY04]|uniref:cytochrome c oxidase assembly protein n=1 Tax=Pelagibacterium sp. 26DY04 TaxID=2967130 RepID=UPI0028165ADE|nr:cytochrome c oxidase assembly protein [Pelagibacterium sp. 26DY04]WMT88503.1 cytochrome c oxidase assembly protein [Pelagibacterium sp. 26DY04]
MMGDIGPLSSHMLQHIALMNLAVPALIFFVVKYRSQLLARSWPFATALQLILLWGWHAPTVLEAAMASPLLMALMHLSLVISAAWFWLAIASMPATGLWRSIFALLVTGKLFCLLGALLVFSPRLVFGQMTHHGHAMTASLADQQIAGLMMLIACPLTYVLAGVWITARWFLALEAQGRADA